MFKNKKVRYERNVETYANFRKAVRNNDEEAILMSYGTITLMDDMLMRYKKQDRWYARTKEKAIISKSLIKSIKAWLKFNKKIWDIVEKEGRMLNIHYQRYMENWYDFIYEQYKELVISED